MKGVLYIGLVSALSIYLPLCVGLVKKSYRNKDLRIFFLYIAIMSLCQTVMLVLALTYKYFHISNIFVIHFGSVAQFVLLTYMMLSYEKNKKIEKIFFQLGIIVFAGIVYDQLIVTDFAQNSTKSLTAASFYLLILSIRTFFNVIRNLSTTKIIITTGLICYYAIHAAVYPSFPNYDPITFSLILMVATLITNIIFAMGLLCQKQCK